MKAHLIKEFIVVLLICLLVGLGCGESETESNPVPERGFIQAPGKIRVKLNQSETSGLEKKFNAQGNLVATPDKILLAIDNAFRVQEGNINQLEDGSYEIVNIPASTEGALVFVDNENEVGVSVNDITVRPGMTTDLGVLEMEPTQDVSFIYHSSLSNLSRLILKINELKFSSEVSSDTEITIHNVPTGNYFFVLMDTNGNIVCTRFGGVGGSVAGTSTRIELNLDDIHFDGTLNGIVKQEGTNIGIENVMVILKPDKDNFLMALTGPDGTYTFHHLPKGSYTLNYKKDGYAAYEQEVSIEQANITVNDVFLSENISSGGISGYVYFADSDVHSNILIGAEDKNKLQPTDARVSRTDGSFLIKNLPEGAYTLNFGQSSDSDYEQKSIFNVQVLNGITAVIEAPVVLQPLTSVVTGSVTLVHTFPGMGTISAKAINETGHVVKEARLTEVEGDWIFSLTVPVGHDYTIEISGNDDDGNAIVPIRTEVSKEKLHSGQSVTLSSPLAVAYRDPNPPELNKPVVVNMSMETHYTGDIYYVNPGDVINIEATAQDEDGDDIVYYFGESGTEGNYTFINEHTGKASWKAPDEGGTRTLEVTARSGSRSDVEQFQVHVNHAPTITLDSPDGIRDSSTPGLYQSRDSVVIHTTILDEDQNQPDDPPLILSWFSNLQGDLKTDGQHLKKVLVPGTHTLTVIAEDALGLKTTMRFYVTVTPAETLWLKAPGAGLLKRYHIPEGVALSDTGSVSVTSDEETICYQSLDEGVVVVDSDGTVNTVGSGTTRVRIYSLETDDEDIPLYETFVAVRVVDSAEPLGRTVPLGIGQIFQIPVNSTTAAEDGYVSLNLNMLYAGHYDVIVFDDKSVVDGSTVTAEIHVNGIKNLEGAGPDKTQFTLDVLNSSTSYTLKLKPTQNSDDLYVKAALIPGYDVSDGSGTPLTSMVWDGRGEFNHSRFTAKEISLSQSVSGTVNTESYDTTDYYKVYLIQGEYMLLFELLRPSNSYASAFVEIEDPTGLQLNEANDGYNTLENEGDWIAPCFTVENDGVYFIKIHRANHYAAEYRFVVYPSAENGLIQDSEGEVNDTEHMATPITLSQSQLGIEGNLNIRPSDRTDWYEIRLEEEGDYTVKLEVLPGSDTRGYSSRIVIIDPEGGVVQEKKVTEFTTFEFSGKAQSTYKFKIHHTNNYKTYYRFHVYPSVENGLVQDSSGEMNDTRSTATPISISEAQKGISGRINDPETDTVDWYRLNIETPGLYTVYCQLGPGTTSGNYDVHVVVEDPYQNILCDNTGGGHMDSENDSTVFDFEASHAGNYILKIYRYYNYNAAYRFYVFPETSNGLIQDSDGEFNDRLSTATPKTLSEAMVGIEGSLYSTRADDAEDVYVIDITEPGTYSVQFELTDGTVRSTRKAFATVYSPSQTPLNDPASSSVYGNGNAYTFTFEAITEGQYRFRIHRVHSYKMYYRLTLKRGADD